MSVDTNMTTENITSADTAAVDATEWWKDVEQKASPVAEAKSADVNVRDRAVVVPPTKPEPKDDIAQADGEEGDPAAADPAEVNVDPG